MALHGDMSPGVAKLAPDARGSPGSEGEVTIRGFHCWTSGVLLDTVSPASTVEAERGQGVGPAVGVEATKTSFVFLDEECFGRCPGPGAELVVGDAGILRLPGCITINEPLPGPPDDFPCIFGDFEGETELIVVVDPAEVGVHALPAAWLDGVDRRVELIGVVHLGSEIFLADKLPCSFGTAGIAMKGNDVVPQVVVIRNCAE